MPRKKVITNVYGPFHVSARTINKEWFNIPMNNVWDIFNDQLFFAKHAFGLKIHCFVLMNNHYHLLISAPNLNLSEAMGYFSRETSRELNRRGNRINRNFSSRFHRCYIDKYHYFMNCFKYVYQNPIRAGMVEKAEEYPFSTLGAKLGKFHTMIPFEEDTLLFDGELKKNIDWINAKPNNQDLESIRAALKKGRFKLRKDRKTRKENNLEHQLL